MTARSQDILGVLRTLGDAGMVADRATGQAVLPASPPRAHVTRYEIESLLRGSGAPRASAFLREMGLDPVATSRQYLLAAERELINAELAALELSR